MRALWRRLLVLSGLAVSACAWSVTAAAGDLVIEHVTVVSAERQAPLRDATVRIHDGRIGRIAAGAASGTLRVPGAQLIDGRGLYLSPGLIDSHVHLALIPGMLPAHEQAHPQIARQARQQIPRSYLYFGYTTLVDLNSTAGLMAGWDQAPLHPDTRFCGGAALLGGYPINQYPEDLRRYMPYYLLEPGISPPPGVDPAQHTPAAVVQHMKSDGALCVKTFFERGFGADHDLPVPKLETIRSLVREAHAAGMPVLMHANASEAQRFALAAGVDIIAHGLWNWTEPGPVTDLTPGVRRLLDDVVVSQVGWQPTIQVLNGLKDLFEPSYLSDPALTHVLPSGLIEWYRTPEGQWFRTATQQAMGFPASMAGEAVERRAREVYRGVAVRDQHAVAYLSAHGARILFGTDTPSAPTYANPPGLNGRLEMQALLEAGMTAAQIFRAATLSNAQALHLPEVGTVAQGGWANLLLLTQDPTQTVEAYDHIVKVILGGQVLEREALAAIPGPPAAAGATDRR